MVKTYIYTGLGGLKLMKYFVVDARFDTLVSSEQVNKCEQVNKWFITVVFF